MRKTPLTLAACAVVLAACGGTAEDGDVEAAATTAATSEATTTVTETATSSTTTTAASTTTEATTTTAAVSELCHLSDDGMVVLEGGIEGINAAGAAEEWAVLGADPEEIAAIICDLFERMLAEEDASTMVQELADRFVPGLVPDETQFQSYHPAPGEQCDKMFAVIELAKTVDLAYRGPAALEGNYFNTNAACDG